MGSKCVYALKAKLDLLVAGIELVNSSCKRHSGSCTSASRNTVMPRLPCIEQLNSHTPQGNIISTKAIYVRERGKAWHALNGYTSRNNNTASLLGYAN